MKLSDEAKRAILNAIFLAAYHDEVQDWDALSPVVTNLLDSVRTLTREEESSFGILRHLVAESGTWPEVDIEMALRAHS